MRKLDIIRTVACFIGAALVGALIGSLISQSLVKIGLKRSSATDTVVTERGNPQPAVSLLTEHAQQTDEEADALTKVPTVHRILWLATQAENASAAELERMLILAEGQGDMQRAIAARWAALDPAHMFNALGAREFTDFDYNFDQILFASWSKSDPRAALEAMRARKESGEPCSSAPLLADNLMREAPEIGIEAMNVLGIQHFLPRMDRIAEWASANPSAAAEKVASMGDDHAGLEAMSEVGKAWGTEDPEAAIQFASSLPGAIGDRLAEAAIAVWTKADPTAAAEFAAAQEDPDLRAQLGKGITAGLAKTDPSAAMNWAEENLQSTARAEAIGGIINTVAKDDIQVAADLVATMNPGGAMNQAVNELMEVWGKGDFIHNDNLFTWVGELADLDTRHRAMQSLQWRIEMNHKDGLIDFIGGKHGHLATDEMLNRAASQRTRQDPESAVTWAKNLPEDRSARALEQVMNTWRSIDPEVDE